MVVCASPSPPGPECCESAAITSEGDVDTTAGTEEEGHGNAGKTFAEVGQPIEVSTMVAMTLMLL